MEHTAYALSMISSTLPTRFRIGMQRWLASHSEPERVGQQRCPGRLPSVGSSEVSIAVAVGGLLLAWMLLRQVRISHLLWPTHIQ